MLVICALIQNLHSIMRVEVLVTFYGMHQVPSSAGVQ